MQVTSGTVPAAIHVSPESICGGPLGLVRDGDVIRLDAHAGRLEVLVDPAQLAGREINRQPARANSHGCGRELFAAFRLHATDAESGARTCNP